MDNQPIILVADDDQRTREALTDILWSQKYRVLQAENGADALELVKAKLPDVVLLDIDMPRMSGIEVLRRIKAIPAMMHIPVVIVTGREDLGIRLEALQIGADDFLTKPPHMAELIARVRTLVKVKAYNDHMRDYQHILEKEVKIRTSELDTAHTRLKESSLHTIYHLSRAAEYKDENTCLHIRRMSNYAAALAKAVGLMEEEVEGILYSSPMHDIGKIGIPDSILLKAGSLDSDEWHTMKQHPTYGARILDGADSFFLHLGRVIAQTHHEKWDGSGYPEGLAGEEIPLEGRITAIADVFDALTSKRPYKGPMENSEAFEILAKGKGTHFDPRLVDAFLSITNQIEEIQKESRTATKSTVVEHI